MIMITCCFRMTLWSFGNGAMPCRDTMACHAQRAASPHAFSVAANKARRMCDEYLLSLQAMIFVLWLRGTNIVAHDEAMI